MQMEKGHESMLEAEPAMNRTEAVLGSILDEMEEMQAE